MKINGNFSLAGFKVSCLSDDDKFSGSKTCFPSKISLGNRREKRGCGGYDERDSHKNSKECFRLASKAPKKKCIKRTLKKFLSA